MKHFFNPLSRTLTVLLSVGLCVACSDKWDEHYSVGPSVPQLTILDYLSDPTNPEVEDYKEFVKVLETTNVLVGSSVSDRKYSDLLDGDQFFTVWVPLKSSISSEEWEKYQKEGKTKEENIEVVTKFINNHMSRIKYSEDGKNKNVLTMSNKHYLMTPEGIEGAKFADTNIPCVNGIIHTLSTKLQYKPNLYEYLISDESYADNVGAFIKKYTKLELNKEKSISAGYYNENDELVYADSVMDETNVVWDMFGYINSEDSVYNMILPRGEHWQDAVGFASQYYHYGSAARADADSLTTYWSNNALLTDAVFNMNKKMQPYYDQGRGYTLVSTSYDLEKDPAKVIQYHLYVNPFGQGSEFVFTDSVECSNGKIYICDEWPFDPYYTFAKPIVVEGEDDARRVSTSPSPLKTWTIVNQMPFIAGDGKEYRLSEDKFRRMSSTSSYTATFSVVGSLSGWNSIYAVIAPNNITRDKAGTTPKQNELTLVAKFIDNPGVVYDSGKKYKPDMQKLDTVYAGTFYFPDCYYDLNTANLQLVLQSKVTSSSPKSMSKDIYLDCLIVEPTVAPETPEL